MEQLYELVIEILNEVQLCVVFFLVHNEDCKEAKMVSMCMRNLPVGFLDARVDHLDENLVKFLKRDHQLLFLLHLTEAVFGYEHLKVEEQVVFAGKFNFYVLNLVLSMTTLTNQPINNLPALILLLGWLPECLLQFVVFLRDHGSATQKEPLYRTGFHTNHPGQFLSTVRQLLLTYGRVHFFNDCKVKVV